MPQSIDDRLYILQNTSGLPDLLRDRLIKADIAYLQDRDGEAMDLLAEIEDECRNRNIKLWKPLR